MSDDKVVDLHPKEEITKVSDILRDIADTIDSGSAGLDPASVVLMLVEDQGEQVAVAPITYGIDGVAAIGCMEIAKVMLTQGASSA